MRKHGCGNIEADMVTVAHGSALKEERGLGEGRGGGGTQTISHAIHQCGSLVRQLRMLCFQV